MEFTWEIVAIAILAIIVLILLIRGRTTIDNRTIGSISERLTKMEDMAKKIDTLNETFVIPFSRGGAGELFLEQLLKNWLPESAFQMQFPFKDGTRVDAVIKMGKLMVAVDSKFPLQGVKAILDAPATNLPNDVKRLFRKQADSISDRYIRPDQGTMPFAFMYIPSEKIYYRAFMESSDSLFDELLQKGVLPVSPSTLFIYLHTVAYGLKGFSFSEKQREYAAISAQLKHDFGLLKKQMGVLGTHLKNLQNSWEEVNVRSTRVETDITKLNI